MKAGPFSGALGALIIGTACIAGAQTQTVTYSVTAINVIAFLGSPSVSVTTATAGSQPTSNTDASTGTWAVTTNQTGSKISGSIASAMPTGLTLSADLAAPSGATGAGFLALGTVAVDLVTGITKLAQGSLAASYRLDATAAAGVVSSATKVVTYTITGGT